MFLFVFQNNMHRKRWGGTDIQMAENRGQFDRRLLNKSLKDYQLVGFGTHALHQIVKDCGAQDNILRGHFLIVETRKQAMWVKLNHDVLAKNDLRLIETYEGLTGEAIRRAFKQHREAKGAYQSAAAEANSSRMHSRRLNEAARFISTNTLFSAEVRENLSRATVQLNKEDEVFAQQAKALAEAMQEAFNNALEVVRSYKIGGTGAAVH